MSFYEVTDTAGHKLTLLTGPQAGMSYYWCEGCGAVMVVRRALAEDAIFQAPKGSLSTLQECSNRTTETPLRDKVLEWDKELMERLRRDAIGLPPGINFQGDDDGP